MKTIRVWVENQPRAGSDMTADYIRASGFIPALGVAYDDAARLLTGEPDAVQSEFARMAVKVAAAGHGKDVTGLDAPRLVVLEDWPTENATQRTQTVSVIQTPTTELRELAAWLDDLAAALDDRKGGAYTPAELRKWMSQQAARCKGRALLARLSLGELPRLSRHPEPAVLGGGCEFCPAAGGGCPVCRPRLAYLTSEQLDRARIDNG